MGEQVAARTKKKCSAVGGRKGRDRESRRTLKTAYTIILQSMNFRLKSGSLCTRRIGSRRSKKLRQDIDRGVIIKVTKDLGSRERPADIRERP